MVDSDDEEVTVVPWGSVEKKKKKKTRRHSHRRRHGVENLRHLETSINWKNQDKAVKSMELRKAKQGQQHIKKTERFKRNANEEFSENYSDYIAERSTHAEAKSDLLSEDAAFAYGQAMRKARQEREERIRQVERLEVVYKILKKYRRPHSRK